MLLILEDQPVPPCRGIAVALRDQGSMEGLLFANITIESLFYERIWWGGAEPIHITAMPRAVNVEVRPPSSLPCSTCMPLPRLRMAQRRPNHAGLLHCRTCMRLTVVGEVHCRRKEDPRHDNDSTPKREPVQSEKFLCHG